MAGDAQPVPAGAHVRHYVSGILARFLRASPLGELKPDHVHTARSKGLRKRDVVGRHVMCNALLPFVTIVGLMVANFIGGGVVTESVFTYPGLARLLIQAISTRDYSADPAAASFSSWWCSC